MSDDEVARYFAGLTPTGRAELLTNMARFICDDWGPDVQARNAQYVAEKMPVDYRAFFIALGEMLRVVERQWLISMVESQVSLYVHRLRAEGRKDA